MKKTYKLIIIGVIVLLVISFFRNRGKEDLRATANLDEEISKITFETDFTPKIENKVLDFSLCEEEDGFTIETDAGKSSIEVLNLDGEYCIVKTSFENIAGSYSNECRVPLIKGEMTFNTANFESISQYCAVREDGSGLLELE